MPSDADQGVFLMIYISKLSSRFAPFIPPQTEDGGFRLLLSENAIGRWPRYAIAFDIFRYTS